jgi:diamine N-acetyltransferase
MEEALKVDRSSVVTLREITEQNIEPVLWLKVSPDQEKFVANNAVSIAQGCYNKRAWFRAIYADETPVGFVMLSIDEEEPEYYLWRYMIDARYQKLGFGRRALEQVIAHVRTMPRAESMQLGCVEGEGSALGFYESMGFRLTGEHEEGEAIMMLDLRRRE